MTIKYQLAGLLDEDRRLGRSVPSGRIVVPEKIWLKGDQIRWRMGEEWRQREVTRSMLNQFVRLTDAQSVLRFARDWGVLALSDNMCSNPKERFYLPGRGLKKDGAEPVDAWLYYSKRAKALLNLATDLNLGELGSRSDWGQFAMFVADLKGPNPYRQFMQQGEAAGDRHTYGLGFSIFSGNGTDAEQLGFARVVLAREVGGWLECWKKQREGSVSDFRLEWRDDQQRWDLQIDYHGLLFPAIALQLALVLADADSLYTCSGCGLPYIRPRERKRPKSGWANYCDLCSRDGVAQRRAAEAYREKVAEAVRLHAAGFSVSKIAKQLKTKAARVQTWVGKGGKNVKTKTRQ